MSKEFTKTIQICNSTDYDSFVFGIDSRRTNDKHVAKLVKSFQDVGWVGDPCLVRKQKGKLEIIDGKHRYLAGKQLGIPIVYVVTDSAIRAPELHAMMTPPRRIKKNAA